MNKSVTTERKFSSAELVSFGTTTFTSHSHPSFHIQYIAHVIAIEHEVFEVAKIQQFAKLLQLSQRRFIPHYLTNSSSFFPYFLLSHFMSPLAYHSANSFYITIGTIIIVKLRC
jgi:hypothetical protein